MNSLKGTGIAIVTPMKNGKIDFDSFGKVIDHVIGGQVEYIVALGTTGESVTLSKQEKIDVLKFCATHINKRVPLIAGFGGYNTLQIIENLNNYDLSGVDYILSVGPYYNKPTQEGIFQHYMAIAEASPLPVIIYNVPSRTACNITAETTIRLANASSKFVAVKEASGDMRQVMELVNTRPEGFLVLSGDDNLTLPMLSLGVDGVISVVGNAYPYEFSEMVRLALKGNYKQAAQLHYSLLPVMDKLFIDGSPAGIKACLEIMGLCDQEVRLPLVPVRDSTYAQLQATVKQIAAQSAATIK